MYETIQRCRKKPKYGERWKKEADSLVTVKILEANLDKAKEKR